MITNLLNFDLSGKDWEFSGAPHGAAAATGPWRKANVPGNVHTDLMALGLLGDPHLGQNEADMAWVEQKDWWYRKKFSLPQGILACPAVYLKADGLDTYATLRVNGRLVGSSQNSLVEHEWEIRRYLKSGSNEILIRFASAALIVKKLEKKHGAYPAVSDPARVYARKAQYSFGWDWGPRLVTSGIFKSLRLEGVALNRITDLRVVATQVSQARASGTIRLSVQSLAASSTTLEVTLGQWRHIRALRLKKGLNHVSVPFSLEHPKLWWPVGYGQPHLYGATAALGTGASASAAVGLRKIKLLREKDKQGESFVFEVNGVKVFCKGANWIPADTFMGRLSEARVRRLVDAAKDSNMNMLRVWGGGFYESEEFYRACDEKGILVWQDFPFACNEVPELPWFKKEVELEAAKAVRRLRRHASLALWCGNNENQTARFDRWYGDRHVKRWGELYYNQVLPRICKALDSQTPYWPGSPFGGKNPNGMSHGDRHNWKTWANFADYMDYREDSGRFLSEFGFASLPNRQALKRAIPLPERYIQSRSMAVHDKVGGAGAYARIAYYMEGHLPVSAGFDDFRYLSQVNQAEALITGIEHWRRRQFSTSGTLFWQLNDCWPVTSWAVLDADDAPKLPWYAIRRAYDPLLLSCFEDKGLLRYGRSGYLPKRAKDEGGEAQAWLTHDWESPVTGTLNVELMNTSGKRRRVFRGKIRVGAYGSSKVWSAKRSSLRLKDPASEFLVFTFEAPGILRRAQLYFERPKLQALKEAGLTISAKRDAQSGLTFVRVRARSLTRYVELHASKPGVFSDNGFDLLPGEARELVFTPASHGPRARFEALSLNAVALKRA
jgi:beta-mannosidase